MISAKEAREKIGKLQTKYSKKERKLIEKKIKKAIENNQYSCIIGVNISEEAQKWLMSLGYRVERFNFPKDVVSTKILW